MTGRTSVVWKSHILLMLRCLGDCRDDKHKTGREGQRTRNPRSCEVSTHDRYGLPYTLRPLGFVYGVKALGVEGVEVGYAGEDGV